MHGRVPVVIATTLMLHGSAAFYPRITFGAVCFIRGTYAVKISQRFFEINDVENVKPIALTDVEEE